MVFSDYERHYGVCKHTLATVFCLRDYDMKTKELNIDVRVVNKNEAKYRNFRQIVNSFYNEEIDDIAEENEDNVKWIEENLPFKLQSLNKKLPEQIIDNKHDYVQILPGKYGMDGFFISAFRRIDK